MIRGLYSPLFMESINGVIQNVMKSPLDVNSSGNTIKNAYIGGWTEGPLIIKRNDTYFLTNTGNHVQSDGYRINYSISKEGPNRGYVMPKIIRF